MLGVFTGHAVVAVHGFEDTVIQPAFNLFTGPCQNFFHQLQLRRSKPREHIIGYLAGGPRLAPDAQAQARKLLVPKVLDNRFQPVVATAAALGTQPDFAQRQVRIVHDNQKPFDRDLIIV